MAEIKVAYQGSDLPSSWSRRQEPLNSSHSYPEPPVGGEAEYNDESRGKPHSMGDYRIKSGSSQLRTENSNARLTVDRQKAKSGRRLQNDIINRGEDSGVLVYVNHSLDPHLNVEPNEDSSTVEDDVRRHRKSAPSTLHKGVTSVRTSLDLVYNRRRADSTSSSEDRERNFTPKISTQNNSTAIFHSLKTPETPVITRTGCIDPRPARPESARGPTEGALTPKQKQNVRGLISPALVEQFDDLDHNWTTESGNRIRSRSDVTYDALPLLENGEIDERSYRLIIPGLTPPISKSPRRLSSPCSIRDTLREGTIGISKSQEQLYSLQEEQVHSSDYKEGQESSRFGTKQVHFKNSGGNGDSQSSTQTPSSSGRYKRRNAVIDIMDNLLERTRAESFRDRGTSFLIPGSSSCTMKSRKKDNTALTRRRRTFSDLSGVNEKTSCKNSSVRRMSITSQQRLCRVQMARQKFVHAIKMVIVMLRIRSMIFKKHKHNKESLTFTEIAEQFQSVDMKSSGLSFDPRDFKAKREINITSDAKNILSMPSVIRTPEQQQTALYALQTMKSFAEYPLHMQEKLVKVAWFECIPPKRVIIRQGHYAENFYFVISGSVVVTIMETRTDTGDPHIRTAAVLRKGSSFGELALLHHSKRTATVASQGEVQLLAIGREDFFDIFMRGQQPGEEPDHIKYLRQLPFMKNWPFERLIEHPEMCLFHFYKRGQVVVKDSNNSEWIYVVKSGTCQVLKQLKAVKPVSKHNHRAETAGDLSLPKLHSRQLSAPELQSKRPTRTRVHHRNVTTSHLQFISVPTIPLATTSQGTGGGGLLPSPREAPSDTFLTRQESSLEAEITPSTFSQYTMTTTDDSSLSTLENGSLPSINFRRGATAPRTSFSRSRFREIASRNPPPPREKLPPSLQMPLKEDSHNSSDSSSSSDKKEGFVFVQIELLLPKDVFGLSTLNVDLGIDHEQSSVNLVSRGAECIMVKKEFFVKFCTEYVRRHIRSLIKPYPPPDLLQHNLQNHSNWTNYKQEEVYNVLRDRSSIRTLKL